MEDTIYVPADLTPEERIELENIRRRKQELLEEIQRLRDELSEAMNEVEGLEANEGSKTLQRNRKMGMGRKKFNMDPKKGIVFLQENELLRNTAEDIARFLYKGEGLNKTAIGDYLGERDDFNISVLHAFVTSICPTPSVLPFPSPSMTSSRHGHNKQFCKLEIYSLLFFFFFYCELGEIWRYLYKAIKNVTE
ncbi:uncharacterized protein LOC503678 [Xenopus laevis]|uniref:LOC503678 protein n=1 Tax=Xenopus laevis TaxID=8355 RepID=Q6DCE0_XENLA|nr:uncharacterized protein LOC503678 [Xenopus laevis]AAH78107.1 LOC503678 protein [Xenopus laevis]